METGLYTDIARTVLKAVLSRWPSGPVAVAAEALVVDGGAADLALAETTHALTAATTAAHTAALERILRRVVTVRGLRGLLDVAVARADAPELDEMRWRHAVQLLVAVPDRLAAVHRGDVPAAFQPRYRTAFWWIEWESAQPTHMPSRRQRTRPFTGTLWPAWSLKGWTWCRSTGAVPPPSQPPWPTSWTS